MSVLLKKTHLGNIQEILADFLLSSLGVANPQRRQFDHGYDFYCTLSNELNGLLTFDYPFNIQIKSGADLSVEYGKTKKWKSEDISWLFNHSIPFFIGFIDTKTRTLQIHDTTGVWYLFGKQKINCSKILFKPNKRESNEWRKLPIETELKKWPKGKGDGIKYEIDLGNPIISISFDDIDDPSALELKRNILRQYIIIERENISNKNLGIFCFKEIKKNVTNKIENIEWGLQLLNNYNEHYITNIYNSINFALISLSMNLSTYNRETELNALKIILKHLPNQRLFKQLYDQSPTFFDWVDLSSE